MAASTRKREARKSLRQPAWLTLDGGFAVRRCLVQNISSAGARITLEEAATLPVTVRLAFSRDARTGRVCRVMWRRGSCVGVKFIG
jgi:PilZ domain